MIISLTIWSTESRASARTASNSVTTSRSREKIGLGGPQVPCEKDLQDLGLRQTCFRTATATVSATNGTYKNTELGYALGQLLQLSEPKTEKIKKGRLITLILIMMMMMMIIILITMIIMIILRILIHIIIMITVILIITIVHIVIIINIMMIIVLLLLLLIIITIITTIIAIIIMTCGPPGKVIARASSRCLHPIL